MKALAGAVLDKGGALSCDCLEQAANPNNIANDKRNGADFMGRLSEYWTHHGRARRAGRAANQREKRLGTRFRNLCPLDLAHGARWPHSASVSSRSVASPDAGRSGSAVQRFAGHVSACRETASRRPVRVPSSLAAAAVDQSSSDGRPWNPWSCHAPDEIAPMAAPVGRLAQTPRKNNCALRKFQEGADLVLARPTNAPQSRGRSAFSPGHEGPEPEPWSESIDRQCSCATGSDLLTGSQRGDVKATSPTSTP